MAKGQKSFRFAPAEKAAELPVFFPDQHRFDWTSMNPALPDITPNLKRLAQNGVHFTNALTPSPVCAPARACLASGREYAKRRVASNGVPYPLDQTTFYTVLKSAGYHVLGCGKFDLDKPGMNWGRDGKHARPSGKSVRDAAANAVPAAPGKSGGKAAARNERPDSGDWSASRDDAGPWLIVDMHRQREFQQVCLVEMHTRIRRFVVERYVESKSAWEPVCQGGRMNYYSVRLPAPVSAQKVRLRVLETKGGPPQVSSFNLYP